MTSLLTNNAAMVALRTLNQINDSLNTTNNRVSTGLRIGEAKDSAAYWAIATTTASDNGALSAVSDALNLGKSTLDVVYEGLDTTRESLQKMKELLVAARQPGVDRAKIQTQINGLVTDMINKANASVINEQNFLAVDTSAAGYNATKSVVASFERSASAITVSTIDLNISTIVLVDSRAAGKTGILDKDRTTNTAGATYASASTYTIAGINIAALTDSAAHIVQLNEMIDAVDQSLAETISAQNTVGVNQARAASQSNFIAALMDANKAAVGSLVDADMEEESTRLRALQTQQQLSVESLSIANASSQNVLALFRN